jgi:hypothetical protein
LQSADSPHCSSDSAFPRTPQAAGSKHAYHDLKGDVIGIQSDGRTMNTAGGTPPCPKRYTGGRGSQGGKEKHKAAYVLQSFFTFCTPWMRAQRTLLPPFRPRQTSSADRRRPPRLLETFLSRIYENYYHLMFEVTNGKVSAVREYVDTLYAKDVLFSWPPVCGTPGEAGPNTHSLRAPGPATDKVRSARSKTVESTSAYSVRPWLVLTALTALQALV